MPGRKKEVMIINDSKKGSSNQLELLRQKSINLSTDEVYGIFKDSYEVIVENLNNINKNAIVPLPLPVDKTDHGIKILQELAKTYYGNFNDDDLRQVSISNIQYKPSNSNEGNITFDLSYKGIKGAKASLPFNKQTYYSDFVTLNNNVIKQKYMYGVYENLDVFLRNMLVFDKTKIIPELVTKNKNGASNSIDATLKLISGDGKETEIATIHKTLTGFKPLSDLKTELVLAHGFELGEYFGKKFRDAKDGDLLERVKLIDPRVWIGKAQFSIKRNGNFISLNKEEVSLRGENSIVTLYTPSDHLGENKDIYLKEPHFTVIQAKKEGNYLRLVLQLVAVNDESLSGVEIPLNIHLIKP